MLRLNPSTIPARKKVGRKAKPFITIYDRRFVRLSRTSLARIGYTDEWKIEFVIMHGKLYITASTTGYSLQDRKADGDNRFANTALCERIYEEMKLEGEKVSFTVLPEPLHYKGYDNPLFELKLNEKI